MAGFYGFPSGQKDLPAVMHMHGGANEPFFRSSSGMRSEATQPCPSTGEVASWKAPKQKIPTPTGEPSTQRKTMSQGIPTSTQREEYRSFSSARNNNWFLLTVGCHSGITFLEEQPEVDADSIGVFGHSMGGRLTGLVAGTDRRVKAASPSVEGAVLQTDFWESPALHGV